MARSRKIECDLDAITAERARLQAELARLDEAEKAAREIVRDAGRATLDAALARVKIGAMSKDEAKAIATAIASLSATEVVRRLTA